MIEIQRKIRMKNFWKVIIESFVMLGEFYFSISSPLVVCYLKSSKGFVTVLNLTRKKYVSKIFCLFIGFPTEKNTWLHLTKILFK